MKPEINIDFAKGYIEKKTLFIEYDMNVYDSVKKDEMKKLLINLLPKEEKKYFSVENFDLKKKKVTFSFDFDKWFSAKSKVVVSNRFEKKVILNKVPSVISANLNAFDIERMILLSFRTYLEKNSKFRQKILTSDPSSTHYKFSYDGHNSDIEVSLKPQFRHSSLVLLRNKEKKEINKTDFDASVYTYLGLKK